MNPVASAYVAQRWGGTSGPPSLVWQLDIKQKSPSTQFFTSQPTLPSMPRYQILDDHNGPQERLPDEPDRADTPKPEHTDPGHVEAQQDRAKKPRDKWCHIASNVFACLYTIVTFLCMFFLLSVAMFYVGMFFYNANPGDKWDQHQAEVYVKPIADRLDQLIHVLNSTSSHGSQE